MQRQFQPIEAQETAKESELQETVTNEAGMLRNTGVYTLGITEFFAYLGHKSGCMPQLLSKRHWIDVGQICNDKVEDASACCNLPLAAVGNRSPAHLHPTVTQHGMMLTSKTSAATKDLWQPKKSPQPFCLAV